MINSFGHIYRLTTFGESHGAALGGIIDGVPAGEPLDVEAVQLELDRRRPGQSRITTARNEADSVSLLSGVFGGVTTGTPIGFTIANSDQRSGDYEEMRRVYRPSHADFTYDAKYGVRDYRGGGRASARETAARVVGGAVARQILSRRGIRISAYTRRIGDIEVTAPYRDLDLSATYSNDVRCPDPQVAADMLRLIEDVRSYGDTVGGIIECVITGVEPGLGEPVFGKLQALLGAAILSIPAVKGFDYGMGFSGCCSRGSEMIDTFATDAEGRIFTLTNHSGGIQGGISNGSDIYFRVGFKPVATLLREVATVDSDGRPAMLHARGRHDACVLPRAVPVVEAMASMTILDAMLMNKTVRL